MSTLTRTRLELPTVDSAIADFAAQTQADLGYRGLSSRVALETGRLRLHRALQQIDIDPLNEGAVTTHKNAFQWGKYWSLYPSAAEWLTDIGAAGVFYACLMASGLAAVLSLVAWTEGNVPGALPYLLLVALGLSIFHPLFCTRRGRGWLWSRVELERYYEPVPAFALQTALRLKQIVPDVKLYVESFEKQQRTSDPFLVARLDGAEVYLEVWDEPQFEFEQFYRDQKREMEDSCV